jgi:hypothetical protein
LPADFSPKNGEWQVAILYHGLHVLLVRAAGHRSDEFCGKHNVGVLTAITREFLLKHVENISVYENTVAFGEHSFLLTKLDSHASAVNYEKLQFGMPMERDPSVLELEEFIDVVLNGKPDSAMPRRLSKHMIHGKFIGSQHWAPFKRMGIYLYKLGE